MVHGAPSLTRLLCSSLPSPPQSPAHPAAPPRTLPTSTAPPAPRGVSVEGQLGVVFCLWAGIPFRVQEGGTGCNEQEGGKDNIFSLVFATPTHGASSREKSIKMKAGWLMIWEEQPRGWSFLIPRLTGEAHLYMTAITRAQPPPSPCAPEEPPVREDLPGWWLEKEERETPLIPGHDSG